MAYDLDRTELNHLMTPNIDPGARAAVILGDDDIAAGVAQVKDLVTGTQEAIPFAHIPSRLK